jgi:hypothetical protein
MVIPIPTTDANRVRTQVSFSLLKLNRRSSQMLRKIDEYFGISQYIHEHDDNPVVPDSDKQIIRVLGMGVIFTGALVLAGVGLLIGAAI